jgi:hypothetical protein
MTRPNSDELDRLEERRAGAQRIRDQRDGVRQLLVERLETSRLAPAQPQPREEEPEEEAEDQDDRVLERGHHEPDEVEHDRRADRQAQPDAEVLGRLELEVGGAEIAQQVRAEVPLLDHPVELGEGGGLLDEVGDTAGPLLRLGLGARGVALQALERDATGAGQCDAQRDQDDRACGEGGDDDRHWHQRDPSS